MKVRVVVICFCLFVFFDSPAVFEATVLPLVFLMISLLIKFDLNIYYFMDLIFGCKSCSLSQVFLWYILSLSRTFLIRFVIFFWSIGFIKNPSTGI